jgi:hypothetical protein
MQEEPRFMRRPAGPSRPVSVGIAAMVLAGFVSLTVLLLRPQQLPDRLLALGVGVGLGLLTLLVAPGGIGGETSTPSEDTDPFSGESRELEAHRWAIRDLEQSTRQLGEQVRDLRQRLAELARQRADAPVGRDPVVRDAARPRNESVRTLTQR